MKKITAMLLTVLCIITAGCGKKEDIREPETEAVPTEQTTAEAVSTVDSLNIQELDTKKVMTVYFSHKDQTELAANFIKEDTGGEIYRIKTVNDYPENPAEIEMRAEDEHNSGVRPALSGAPGSMKDFDIIFLCFPAWSGTMPMAVWTFIEDYDMRGKAVIPIIEGSEEELSEAIEDIYKIEPEMTIVDGFAFDGEFMKNAGDFEKFINKAVYGE